MDEKLIEQGYKFIYLDTNALSEIAKNKNNFGKNFLTFMLSDKYALITSIYNLYELNNSKDEYKKMIFQKFDLIPVLICNTFPQIPTLELNKDSFILFATGAKPLFDNQFSTLFKMLDGRLVDAREKLNTNLKRDEQLWIEKLNKNTECKELFSDSYKIYDNFNTDINLVYNSRSSKIFSYIKYNFLNLKPGAVNINSILDTYNVCISPFVDVYVGERTVTSWLKMSKNQFSFMKDIEFIKVSEFYDK